jgi:hypothetical protein
VRDALDGYDFGPKGLRIRAGDADITKRGRRRRVSKNSVLAECDQSLVQASHDAAEAPVSDAAALEFLFSFARLPSKCGDTRRM